MSAAADSLREFLAPLLPGWRIQFGAWRDGSKDARYAVIRPVGGLPAELVRRPVFTLLLIDALNADAFIASAVADAVVEFTRENSGGLVLIQASEPVGPTFTSDGRAMFEIAISTITN